MRLSYEMIFQFLAHLKFFQVFAVLTQFLLRVISYTILGDKNCSGLSIFCVFEFFFEHVVSFLQTAAFYSILHLKKTIVCTGTIFNISSLQDLSLGILRRR